MNTKAQKSMMWQFFTRNEDSVTCKTCFKVFKYSGNTSNMKDHLNRKHPQLLLLSPTTSHNQNGEENQNIQENIQTNTTNYYNANSSKKKMLDRLFTRMVAIDMEPLRLAEREGLRDFVKCLDPKYEMPGRTTIATKLLPEMYLQMKIQLMEMIKNIKHLAITADTWTSKNNQGVLAITSHFIFQNRLESALLAALVVEGHHDADNISSVIGSVLEEWDCRTKVVAIVTDNAATMIKVAELLKIRHIPCFAHSLNLVIKHTLQECVSLKELIARSKEMVTFFKHSTLASDQLKRIQRTLNNKELKLIQHVETRWNSALMMLRRIGEMRDELTLAVAQNPKAPPNLTADQYVFIEEVTKLFEPLESCTEAVSGETYATLSLVIPLIKGLLLRIAQLDRESFTGPGKEVLETLKKYISLKIKPYEARTPCIVATFLNPHFKKQGFKIDSEVERAITLTQKEYVSFLLTQRREAAPSGGSDGLEDIGNSEITDASAKRPKLDLLSFLQDSQQSGGGNATADAIVDINQYSAKPIIPRTEYPIEYWAYNESSLKHIALKYLCIPGSSTPAERIFSKAGQIIVERRSRLSQTHINELLFVKQNYKLLQK